MSEGFAMVINQAIASGCPVIVTENSGAKEYVEQNNIKVFIDPKATMFLVGSEMDYSSDKLASRFVFKNPNEKSTCGCGESFSI